jgi:AraC family transcriptional regulator, regulatory protein of adaptative response / DNA-3-methyladenine glycosylase II
MLPDHETCYRAIVAKDARFDGRLFTGVLTTGIYCRPICPARVPKSQNVNFYMSAASAHEAGFRPCLRCRPETAPDTPAWRGTSASIGRALRLIEEGALDENSVEHLAMRLGIGERQLRRLFLKHVGASPVAVAQTRRILLAKQLLHETRLPMAQVGLASGFGSIRRFNEVFSALFKRAPSDIRRGLAPEVPHQAGGEIALKLRFRPPYDWDRVASFLAHRLYDGVERLHNGIYARTFVIDGIQGSVQVGKGGKDWLNVSVNCDNLACLPKVIAKVRAAFDLGSDPASIGAHLSADPIMAALVAKAPGLRLPASWDGFEGIVRAVLGQQITVKAAIALGNKLTQTLGREWVQKDQNDNNLTHFFPLPAEIAQADLGFMPMPKARQRTLSAIAAAFVDNPRFLDGPSAEVRERLSAIPGIGPWTRDYISLRVLGDPDALPATDVALLRAQAALTGTQTLPEDLQQQGEVWRPWRSYGAQHLWASLVPS